MNWIKQMVCGAAFFPALICGTVFLINFVAIYYLMIRPQQKREKERRAMVQALTEGDEVVTNSGIHGVIVEVEPNIVWVEVAPDVELKLTRDAVAMRQPESGASGSPDGEDDDS